MKSILLSEQQAVQM